MLVFLKDIVYMTVLFSNKQKYVVKVMFCQILQFVSVLKTQQIKMLIVQELFTFRIAAVTGAGECALCSIVRSLIC